MKITETPSTSVTRQVTAEEPLNNSDGQVGMSIIVELTEEVE